MPEPFKNLFSPALINALADHLLRAAEGRHPFQREAFVRMACTGLGQLEMKDRSRQITRALTRYLPQDFAAACAILLAALHPEEDAPLSRHVMDERGVRGWAIMPMADFVADNGLHNFDLAMSALAQMTKRFSAEFAVRPFIIHDLERAQAHLRVWARDCNVHVRRLASEGSRPRLPWGIRIASLVDNPRPLLPVLEMLRDDSSEYVRKSVANHLNDIAKDHPHLVTQIAEQWLEDAPPYRVRLMRHACRTLIKQGHEDVLRLFGYSPVVLADLHFTLSASVINIGATVELQMVVSVEHKQALLVDYIVHFCLSSGRTGKKVYKWKMFQLDAGETATLRKRHSFSPVTTRVFYPGLHKIELQVNGRVVAERSFELCVPTL